jgi:MarR family transcriptional regulator for hemolysin
MATSRSIRALYDSALRKVDLSLTEALLMAYVDHHGAMSQTALAERLGISRAAVTCIVEGLLRRHLIDREVDPSDGRRKLITVTKTGRTVAERISDIDLELRAELRKGLPKADRAELARILLQIQRNVARVRADQPSNSTC